MVCVPCIVIPVLLYIWHRFLQPIFLKFWNPWAKVITNPFPPLPLFYRLLLLLNDRTLLQKSDQVDTGKKVEGDDGGSNGLPPGHTAAVEKANGSSCPFSGKTKQEESKKTS